MELGSKDIITFNNEFLQRAAWYKKFQQKSDELFSSSGKPGPGFAQFPKMREEMKLSFICVQTQSSQLSGEATRKAGKASAMREGLLGKIVHQFVRGYN